MVVTREVVRSTAEGVGCVGPTVLRTSFTVKFLDDEVKSGVKVGLMVAAEITVDAVSSPWTSTFNSVSSASASFGWLEAEI